MTRLGFRSCSLALMLIAAVGTAHGQSLNGGFEDWELNSRDGVEIPVGWTNSAYGLVGRLEESHSGNYALKVWNWYCSTLGCFALGTEAPSEDGLRYVGVPLAIRPNRLTGYYRYDIEQGPFEKIENDSAAVCILLKRYDHSRGDIDTLSYSMTLLPSVSEWTEFSITLPERIPGAVPDSIALAFYTGNPLSSAHNGVCSFLELDDVSLSTVSGVLPLMPARRRSLEVIPNPVVGDASLRFDGAAGTAYLMRIYDAAGRLAMERKFVGPDPHLTSLGLPAGTYHVSILDDATSQIASGGFVVE